MATTLIDPDLAAMCPACGAQLAPDTTVCSACERKKRAGGTRHPAAKAIIGIAWFCIAVVVLWFFGSVAMGPWLQSARTGPMPLPGGGQFDLTLGRGGTARCSLQVTRDGRSTEVVIMQSACNRIAAHRWLVANRQLPQFQGATLGIPYTIPAPPGAEETATRTRLVVSCFVTLAAGLVGALLMLGSIAVATRLMRPKR